MVCRLKLVNNSSLMRAQMPSPKSIPLGTIMAARPWRGGALSETETDRWVALTYGERVSGVVAYHRRRSYELRGIHRAAAISQIERRFLWTECVKIGVQGQGFFS